MCEIRCGAGIALQVYLAGLSLAIPIHVKEKRIITYGSCSIVAWYSLMRLKSDGVSRPLGHGC